MPDEGRVLAVTSMVAESDAVRELIEGLRRGGLVGRHSVAGHPHLTVAGRAARNDLEDSGAATPAERRVAVLGAAGITDAGLRGIFETPDPPLGSELAGRRRRKNAAVHSYGDVRSDPPVPGYPGISGHW